MLFQHGPSGHFFGSLAVAAGPLSALLDVLVLALLLAANAVQVLPPGLDPSPVSMASFCRVSPIQPFLVSWLRLGGHGERTFRVKGRDSLMARKVSRKKQVVVGKSIRARFSGGVLKPLEPLQLQQGEEVTIKILSRRSTLDFTALSGNYGYRGFYTDETGVLRATRENRPATAQDPPA